MPGLADKETSLMLAAIKHGETLARIANYVLTDARIRLLYPKSCAEAQEASDGFTETVRQLDELLDVNRKRRPNHE